MQGLFWVFTFLEHFCVIICVLASLGRLKDCNNGLVMERTVCVESFLLLLLLEVKNCDFLFYMLFFCA